MNTGNLAEAAHRFQEARRLAQQAESPRREGGTFNNLRRNTVIEMKIDEAGQLAVEALQRFEVAGDQYDVGLATFNQAGLEMVTDGNRLGSMPAEDARQLLVRLEPMLEIARTLEERNSLGHALEQVGTVAIMAHRYSDAADFLTSAVDAFEPPATKAASGIVWTVSRGPPIRRPEPRTRFDSWPPATPCEKTSG